eukprot:TRINITY_DN5272_c0_g2_i1.p1 TRINITY_DN5272_c0_g2~~TRINITY_DN5272_c0_g2_i1.p1  ORF type:complete len:274 (+),score=71.90 TRINITY_DN5272_c0_g2_i1:178-999(+)
MGDAAGMSYREAVRAAMHPTKYFFHHHEEDRHWGEQYGTSVWFATPGAHVAWRGALFAAWLVVWTYALACSITGPGGQYFLIYLTIWTATVELLYLALHFLLAVAIYRRAPPPDAPPTALVRWAWRVRAVAQPVAVLVSLGYWGLIYPVVPFSVNDGLLHAGNTVIVVLDVLSCAYVVRLPHFIYGVVYACVYTIWSCIHWACKITNGHDHRYIYPFLQWSAAKWPVTLTIVLALGLVVVPLCNLLIWSLARFRDRLMASRASRAAAAYDEIA